MTSLRRGSRLTSDSRSSRVYLSQLRWREVTAVRPMGWGALAPWRAARVGFGVVVPLAIGSASGHLEYGGFAALGALPAGFASFPGVSRTRMAAVTLASAGAAVSTFVGATTAAAAPWLLVVAVLVWGYLSGLAVSLGQRWSVAILQWGVALMIAVGVPLGPGPAAGRAGLVLAGGLFQGLLVAGSWVVRRGGAERNAIADSYRELSTYAAGVAAGQSEPPPPVPFPAASVLEDPNPLIRQATRLTFLELLKELEGARASLAAVAAEAPDLAPDDAQQLRRLSADCAAVLDLVADALSARRHDRGARADAVSLRSAALAVPSDAASQAVVEALAGQLGAMARLVVRLAERPGPADAARAISRQTLPDRKDGTRPLSILTAAVSVSTEAGRHALRLAMVAAAAEVMVLATGLREGRWVVLTLFIVLKPDYGSTVHRSVQRALGTALGAGLGVALAPIVHLGRWELVIVAGITVAAAYALFEVAYVLYSVLLTAFIVVLLDILGIPALPTATARLAATAIGGALALIAYFAWPTWEAASCQEKFARLLDAHANYALALLRQLAHPGRLDEGELRGLQRDARRARKDAEASAARLSDEPPQTQLTPQLADALVATGRRLTQSELTLHTMAPLQSGHAHDIAPSDGTVLLDRLAEALGTTMTTLARSVRTMEPPAAGQELRQLHVELTRQAVAVDRGLARATEGLVDAVDVLSATMREYLPTHPQRGPAGGHLRPGP